MYVYTISMATSVIIRSYYFHVILPPLSLLTLDFLNLGVREVHRYGNILGDNHLKNMIRKNLLIKGFDTESLDIMITSGANQAFTNITLALCDMGDSAGR